MAVLPSTCLSATWVAGRLLTFISVLLPPLRVTPQTTPPPTAPPTKAQHRARAVIFRLIRFFFTGFISCTGCWGPA